MEKDIVLFYYYSATPLPEECWLDISKEILHRNLFLEKCSKSSKINTSLIHFEFPQFEDHSYNSICNGRGLKSLLKRINGKDKYIIFRTRDPETGNKLITGYYKVGEAYYQETSLFDDKGYIWGIKADETHLIERDKIDFRRHRNYLTSWNRKSIGQELNKLLDRIKTFEDKSFKYKKETNDIISILKDEEKVKTWKENCEECAQKSQCEIYRRYEKHKSDYDLFSMMNGVYNSNLYSRNVLEDETKKKLNMPR